MLLKNMTDFVGAFFILIVFGLVLLVAVVGILCAILSGVLEWRAIQREHRKKMRRLDSDVNKAEQRYMEWAGKLEQDATKGRRPYGQY